MTGARARQAFRGFLSASRAADPLVRRRAVVSHRFTLSALRRCRAGTPVRLPSKLVLEGALQRECGRAQDFVEGATAFMEKRHANFKGK